MQADVTEPHESLLSDELAQPGERVTVGDGLEHSGEHLEDGTVRALLRKELVYDGVLRVAHYESSRLQAGRHDAFRVAAADSTQVIETERVDDNLDVQVDHAVVDEASEEAEQLPNQVYVVGGYYGPSAQFVLVRQVRI